MTATLLRTARLLASVAHTGQTRKYTGAPYLHHCEEVANIIAEAKCGPEIVAAAWLHDVPEDTKWTVDYIRRALNEDVARLVWWLTDEPTWVANRATRRALTRSRLALAPAAAQTIKCADLISNTKDIAIHDPKFARVYLPEKRAVLDVLNHAHPDVLAAAWAALELASAELLTVRSV